MREMKTGRLAAVLAALWLGFTPTLAEAQGGGTLR